MRPRPTVGRRARGTSKFTATPGQKIPTSGDIESFFLSERFSEPVTKAVDVSASSKIAPAFDGLQFGIAVKPARMQPFPDAFTKGRSFLELSYAHARRVSPDIVGCSLLTPLDYHSTGLSLVAYHRSQRSADPAVPPTRNTAAIAMLRRVVASPSLLFRRFEAVVSLRAASACGSPILSESGGILSAPLSLDPTAVGAPAGDSPYADRSLAALRDAAGTPPLHLVDVDHPVLGPFCEGLGVGSGLMPPLLDVRARGHDPAVAAAMAAQTTAGLGAEDDEARAVLPAFYPTVRANVAVSARLRMDPHGGRDVACAWRLVDFREEQDAAIVELVAVGATTDTAALRALCALPPPHGLGCPLVGDAVYASWPLVEPSGPAPPLAAVDSSAFGGAYMLHCTEVGVPDIDLINAPRREAAALRAHDAAAATAAAGSSAGNPRAAVHRGDNVASAVAATMASRGTLRGSAGAGAGVAAVDDAAVAALHREQRVAAAADASLAGVLATLAEEGRAPSGAVDVVLGRVGDTGSDARRTSLLRAYSSAAVGGGLNEAELSRLAQGSYFSDPKAILANGGDGDGDDEGGLPGARTRARDERSAYAVPWLALRAAVAQPGTAGAAAALLRFGRGMTDLRDYGHDGGVYVVAPQTDGTRVTLVPEGADVAAVTAAEGAVRAPPEDHVPVPAHCVAPVGHGGEFRAPPAGHEAGHSPAHRPPPEIAAYDGDGDGGALDATVDALLAATAADTDATPTPPADAVGSPDPTARATTAQLPIHTTPQPAPGPAAIPRPTPLSAPPHGRRTLRGAVRSVIAPRAAAPADPVSVPFVHSLSRRVADAPLGDVAPRGASAPAVPVGAHGRPVFTATPTVADAAVAAAAVEVVDSATGARVDTDDFATTIATRSAPVAPSGGPPPTTASRRDVLWPTFKIPSVHPRLSPTRQRDVRDAMNADAPPLVFALHPHPASGLPALPPPRASWGVGLCDPRNVAADSPALSAAAAASLRVEASWFRRPWELLPAHIIEAAFGAPWRAEAPPVKRATVAVHVVCPPPWAAAPAPAM